jgi:hypothetical protein
MGAGVPCAASEVASAGSADCILAQVGGYVDIDVVHIVNVVDDVVDTVELGVAVLL